MKNIPLLEIKNVKKSFFGNQVLQDINLSLHKGEIMGLVGENGAGKSTLMKILFGMGMIKETGGYEGEILLNGNKIQFQSPFDAIKAGVGMVHQEFSLIPGFSVIENILLNREPVNKNVFSEIFGERLNTLNYKKMTSKAQNAIDLLDIDLDSHMTINEMPVGHKQFTEIARELSKDNLKLLILDEPTAVLTEKESVALLSSIKKMSELGIAIIFITHRLQEILDVCDKVVVMRDGYIVSNVNAKDTNIEEITKSMIGRNIEVEKKVLNTLSTKNNIMQIKNLWVDMPGEVVRDITLDIKEGEILGIGGLAGQGKLGIPNGIMGLYEAGGEVIFDGNSIPLNNPRKFLDSQIAFVSEDRREVGLLLDESLEWNIAFNAMQIQNKFLKTYFGGLIKCRDEKAIKDISKYYINELQIKCISPSQKAKELSGGNQQKVCLAKSFALQPRFLFVSEPTRGIDVGAKSLVLQALKRFNKENNVTIVMISSELEELRHTCDRIAIVTDGKISGILDSASSSEEFGFLMIGKTK
ncbi:MAG: sugar ABC transporter ATP-binding protein [Eubacteriales bacterium]|nr:sugar ABC transporter ATP-binding protein [Eubacteriales bacterium]